METVLLNQMIAEHTSQLKSFAFKFTKDWNVADDLTQDTFLKAIRYFDNFSQGTNMQAWLFTIMRNIFINEYRRRTRTHALITQKSDISCAHLMKSATTNDGEGRFAMQDIRKALSSIPESYSAPFLKYFEGYKYHEISDELGLPLGTVKTRIHCARQILQKRLKAYRTKLKT